MIPDSDRRRHSPSYIIPYSYYALELASMWLFLSLFEVNLSILEWSLPSYAVGLIWIIYTTMKLKRVLVRQKEVYVYYDDDEFDEFDQNTRGTSFGN